MCICRDEQHVALHNLITVPQFPLPMVPALFRICTCALCSKWCGNIKVECPANPIQRSFYSCCNQMVLTLYCTFQVFCNQVAFTLHIQIGCSQTTQKGLCFFLIHVANSRIRRAWTMEPTHTNLKYDRSSMIFNARMQVIPTRFYKSFMKAMLRVQPCAQKVQRGQQTWGCPPVQISSQCLPVG